MHKKLLKGIATVSLLSVLPVNAAMAADMSTPIIDAQQESSKITRLDVMPRVMMEHYIDDYTLYCPNPDRVPSTFLYKGVIGGVTFTGLLDLYEVTKYEDGAYIAHYCGMVFAQS